MRTGRTASLLLVCDMWDAHWCTSATQRTAHLATLIAAVVEDARARGVFVVHAPSDTMRFYEGTPARQRMERMPAHEPTPREIAEPEQPHTPRHGCPDDPACVPAAGPPWPWTRQHEAIRIDDSDGVSDDGREVYSAYRELGAERIVYAGVHTDLCVLDRPFGIRQMVRWGVECAIVGDLTEAFWPDETSAVLAHIERYLCPAIGTDEI